MTGTYKDFRGIDALQGNERLIGELLLLNELGSLSDGYHLANASMRENGYSFGGNQLDLMKRSSARDKLKDILIHAKDSEGKAAVPDAAPFYGTIEPIIKNNAQRPEGTLSPEQIATVNRALSSDYGRNAINEDFVKEVHRVATKIDGIIGKLPPGKIRTTLETSLPLRLVLIDYDNFFGIDPGQKMEQWLQGKPVIGHDNVEQQLKDSITIDDIFAFIRHTESYAKQPKVHDEREASTRQFLAQKKLIPSNWRERSMASGSQPTQRG